LHKVVTGDTSLDEAVRKTQTDELEIEMSGVIEKG
jgi:hypothetical protein